MKTAYEQISKVTECYETSVEISVSLLCTLIDSSTLDTAIKQHIIDAAINRIIQPR